MDQLEAKRYARRRPIPENNRVILVSLTESGDRTIEDVFPATVSVHDGAISQFSAAERAQFLNMLHRILGNMRLQGAMLKVNGTHAPPSLGL